MEPSAGSCCTGATGCAPASATFERAVDVTRSGMVENVHCAAVALADAHGNLIAFLGDPEQTVLLRSAMKFIQALPFFLEKVHERYSLGGEAQAVTMASHSGQKVHTDASAEILAAAGVDPSALVCGRFRPFHLKTAALLGDGYTAMHNPCSGKHAMMLATCVHLGLPSRGYTSPDHPLQKMIRAMAAKLAGMGEEDQRVAVDGCTTPVFSMSLRGMATAYAAMALAWRLSPEHGEGHKTGGSDGGAREAWPERLPVEWIPPLAHMARLHVDHPLLIAGENRMDTEMMTAMNARKPRAACKVGGDGLHGTSVLTNGTGLAVKVSHGGYDPIPPVVIESLRQTGGLGRMFDGDAYSPVPVEGSLEKDDAALLKRLWKPPVKTVPGDVIGEWRPVFTLSRRLHKGDLEERGLRLPV